MAQSDFLKGACSRCGGHIEFPAKGAGGTIACPHCGQPTELRASVASNKRSTRVRWGAGVALLLAGAGAAAVWLNPGGKPRGMADQGLPQSSSGPTNLRAQNMPLPVTNVVAAEPRVQVATNDFAVMPFQLERTAGSSIVYVTGFIRNTSDRQRFGVKIEFGLLDTNEEPVGTATDYQQVIEPHADWSFKAMVIPSKAVTAQFNAIEEEK